MRQKRSLAQVFLNDRKYLNKIVEALAVEEKVVLEIGPGRGQVSAAIANRARRLYCVEIDRRFCLFLKDFFSGNPRVEIIQSDILKFPLSGLGQELVVFGNVPYQISTSLVKYLINQRSHIRGVFLTFQKEFAEKLLAKPASGQYGFISCYFQYYARAKKLFTIPRSAFAPEPKVDSTFLKIDFYHRLPIKANDADLLFKVIKRAFSTPRKKIINTLGLNRAKQKIVSSLKIDLNLRPRDLSLKDYVTITNKLYPQKAF